MKDLRELRELAGITQFALSRRSQVSRMRLSLAECEQIELNAKEAERITKILLAAIQLRHARIAMVLANEGFEHSPIQP
jgi:transcriptional regulator with XRE-family HTH domain